MIEKRKPLAPTAKRAGWVGCTIHLDMVPAAGRIFYVKDRAVVSMKRVSDTWRRTWFLNDLKDPLRRGWMLDLMGILDEIGAEEFTLSDVYKYEDELQKKHPENKHVRDKIRQQLQTLRDKGFLRFLGSGRYKLVSF